MTAAVAKKGDRVVAVDALVVLVSTPNGTVPTLTPLPFEGELPDDLATSVLPRSRHGPAMGEPCSVRRHDSRAILAGR